MEKNKDRIIRKKRSLFTCSQDGMNNLLEQNIFNLYLYLLKKVYIHSYSKKCRIYINELNKFLGNKAKNITNEKLYKGIIKNLEPKCIQLNVLNNIVKTKRLEPGSYKIPIFGTIYVHDKYVEFSITDEMLQLIKITSEETYTSVRLSIAQQATCKYTPKFYEFISYYTKFTDSKKTRNNDITISVKKLKEFLSISDSQYENFNSLKKRVLIPVQKECAKFGLVFKYDYINFKNTKKIEFIKVSMSNDEKDRYQELKKKIVNISDNDDQIFLQAKEHARETTLEYLNSELLNSKEFCKNVESIQLGHKISMYVFKLKDGHYKDVNFDDLKYIIKYFHYFFWGIFFVSIPVFVFIFIFIKV